MDFDAIFEEYYPLFRGQSSSIPTETAPEYQLGIVMANNAIRKWDRTDGVEWNELWTTASLDGTGDIILSENNTEYSAPTNMRKPPAFIYVGDTSHVVTVIPSRDAEKYGFTSAVAWFTGSANKGYTLNFNPSGSFNDVAVDYIYMKKPQMITRGRDKPDMSDPNFMIQDMLASRFANLRNGFGYKIAKQEATTALQNMKIENEGGTAGNSAAIEHLFGGWGKIGRTSATNI